MSCDNLSCHVITCSCQVLLQASMHRVQHWVLRLRGDQRRQRHSSTHRRKTFGQDHTEALWGCWEVVRLLVVWFKLTGCLHCCLSVLLSVLLSVFLLVLLSVLLSNLTIWSHCQSCCKVLKLSSVWKHFRNSNTFVLLTTCVWINCWKCCKLSNMPFMRLFLMISYYAYCQCFFQ